MLLDIVNDPHSIYRYYTMAHRIKEKVTQTPQHILKNVRSMLLFEILKENLHEPSSSGILQMLGKIARIPATGSRVDGLPV